MNCINCLIGKHEWHVTAHYTIPKLSPMVITCYYCKKDKWINDLKAAKEAQNG